MFSLSEGYLIEGGKMTQPIKGATLVGDGPSVLHKVAQVGQQFELDSGKGMCGKEGQQVPVGVGMPPVLVSELTVGGQR